MGKHLSNLPEAYSRIKPAIVAVVAVVSTQPYFPKIIGTGFIVREDGIILTCDHVIKALDTLPKPKDFPKDKFPASVVLFHHAPKKGMSIVRMEITGVGGVAQLEPGGTYYGKLPDLGLIRVNYGGLPKLELKPQFNLSEGDIVATCGFPMGEGVLLAPGWLHQISPVLQTGVVSSILPFPCDSPHGFLMDYMSKGGSSGSPIFDVDTGEVHGMVYASLQEKKSISGRDGVLVYSSPSSLTLAISNNMMRGLMEQIDEVPEFKSQNTKDMKDFKKDVVEAVEKGEFEIVGPGKPILERVSGIETQKVDNENGQENPGV